MALWPTWLWAWKLKDFKNSQSVLYGSEHIVWIKTFWGCEGSEQKCLPIHFNESLLYMTTVNLTVSGLFVWDFYNIMCEVQGILTLHSWEEIFKGICSFSNESNISDLWVLFTETEIHKQHHDDEEGFFISYQHNICLCITYIYSPHL